MAQAPDGRHRDKNGEIDRKHGNTKMKNLKPDYPELNNFHNEDTLSQVEDRYNVDSLDQLLDKVRDRK